MVCMNPGIGQSLDEIRKNKASPATSFSLSFWLWLENWGGDALGLTDFILLIRFTSWWAGGDYIANYLCLYKFFTIKKTIHNCLPAITFMH